MEEKKQTIGERIIAVMREIEPIAKERKNTAQGYSFRGIDDVMNSFAPLLAKHGIIPSIKNIESIKDEEVTSNSGARGWRTVKRLTIAFIAEDGSCIEVVSDGEAIDYGDKGSNKAMSVAYREAFFKTFCVPFGNDDIENHEHDLKAKKLEEDVKEIFGDQGEGLMCNVCKSSPAVSRRTGKSYCPNWKEHPQCKLVPRQEINLNDVPF